jgi:hypothetical protein
MFRPKGLRIASLYLRTVVSDRVPARVSVKFEDKFDHHLLAKMVISGLTSPIVWRIPVSMLHTKVYVSPLKGLRNLMLLVSSQRRMFQSNVTCFLFWLLFWLVFWFSGDGVAALGRPLFTTRLRYTRMRWPLFCWMERLAPKTSFTFLTILAFVV